MSNINQIVVSGLLNSINSYNLNNRKSSSIGSNPFDVVLKNTIGNFNNAGNSCKCNTTNSNFDSLNMLNTLLGSLNNNRIDESKIDNESLVNVNNEKNVSSKMNNAIDLLKQQVGKPYVWGANGPESFDCSGLVRYIYKTALGKDIPRVSYDQSKFGQAIDKKDLQVGDLVFFDTMNKGRVSHVGMYIGNDEFIHASNKKDGVKKSKLSGYYEKTYKGARRP